MILAAGFGTRLAPLTDTLPKALVPVGGRPMIAHAIEAVVRAGATRVVVNAHHHAAQIEAHLSSHDCGVPVTVVREREILGTGGGILHARALLDGDEPFLVHNADIVTDADLRPLVSACASGAFASLLVMRRDTARALVFDATMHLMGKEVWVSEGVVYPADAPRFAFCGVHAVSPEIFRCGYPEGFSDIFDIYRRVLAQGARIAAHVHDGVWSDLGSVGKIREYERMRDTH